jgi:Raf kinase inhibitor-like YbhB/YbcL family protein
MLFMLLFITGPAPSNVPGLVRGSNMALEIQSSAFSEGATIPTKHTCDGVDVSPELSWSGVPEPAKSLALVCDDPDAPVGNWVHWVLYDLPVASGGQGRLPEGVPTTEQLEGAARQGLNDFGKIGYGGPCPPPGKPHRYQFKLYALDRSLNLPAGASKAEFLKASKGHILAQAQLTGLYKR